MFGLSEQYVEETETYTDPVLSYLRSIPIGTLSSFQARLLLKGKFMEIYGLRSFEHDDPENPYPFVAKNPLEDLTEHRPSYERIDRFIRDRIASHTGMSLKEFLSLPRHMVERIFKSCERINQMEDNQAAELSSSLDSIQQTVKKNASNSQKIILPNSFKR